MKFVFLIPPLTTFGRFEIGLKQSPRQIRSVQQDKPIELWVRLWQA